MNFGKVKIWCPWQSWCIVSLLRCKVYLWIIACPLIWQTNPHNQTFYLFVLVSFTKMNPTHPWTKHCLWKNIWEFLLNQSYTPIAKQRKLNINIFHLICFHLRTYAHENVSILSHHWTCVKITSKKILIRSISHIHNCTQKAKLCAGHPNSLKIIF